MKLINKIKHQLTKPDIHKEKAHKLAETERFLYSHRQTYRSAAPMGFKSRAESSYHFSRATR